MARFTTQVAVAGNLTRDPEVRYTGSGQPVASFAVASTPQTYNKDTRQWEDAEPVFTDCVLWGKAAENLAASARKGSRVLVFGTQKTRSWTDKEGNPQRKTELVADEVGLSVQFSSYGAGGSSSKSDAPVPGEETTTQIAGDDTPW